MKNNLHCFIVHNEPGFQEKWYHRRSNRQHLLPVTSLSPAFIFEGTFPSPSVPPSGLCLNALFSLHWQILSILWAPDWITIPRDIFPVYCILQWILTVLMVCLEKSEQSICWNIFYMEHLLRTSQCSL